MGQPATVAQQPVNSGKACCPFAAQKPCNADNLDIKVEFKEPTKEGEKDAVRQLSTNIVKRKPVKWVRSGRASIPQKPYPALSLGANELLARYDFVIECFADFPQPRATTATEVKAALKELVTGEGKRFAKEKAKVTAKAKFFGLHCEPQQHGLLVMKPLSGKAKATPEMTSKKVDQADNAIPMQEFCAQRFPLLDDAWADLVGLGGNEVGGDSGVGAMFIFDLIASIFGALYPAEIEVVAHSCGKRPKEQPAPVNTDLRGLVRVFRKDTWTLGIKIPSLGEFKREKAGTRQLLTGQTERTFSQEGRFGNDSNKLSTTQTTRGNGVTVSQSERETWNDGRGSSLSQTSTTYGAIKKIESESKYSDRDGSSLKGFTKEGGVYGRPTRELVAERLKQSSGFDVTIARNGAELPIKGTIDKVKKSVETFAKILADVQEMFRKAPQIGWKVSFEISALAGTIVIEAAPRCAPLAADGRYYPVNYEITGKLEIELVNLKISLSFGLDAQVLDSGLVLKVEGSVSVKVQISVDLNLDMLKNPVKEIGLTAESTNELKITGYVSVLGKTVAGAELSIANGFEFKDGKLLIDVTKPSFDLKGTLRCKDTTVSGWIKVPWWWDKKVDKVKLLDGCDIHTFK